MSEGVSVLVADPQARVVSDEDGLWICSDVRVDELVAFLTTADRMDAVRRSIGRVTEDALVVRVGLDGGRVRSVDAFRSVTANRDLYYLHSSDGEFVVADQFRNALAHLDVADRVVTDRAVADHLLFRAPIEPTTYVERVRALPQGTWLHWDATTDDCTTAQVDTLTPVGHTRPRDAPDAIDRTLDRLLGPPSEPGTEAETTTEVESGTTDDLVTMLSGGVDSTLLHTYLEDDAAALVAGVDSPEYAFELDYADRACDLLDARDRWHVLAESDFGTQLATSVDALGFPSHYAQTVFTDAAFRADEGDCYLNGEGADALFGLTGTKGFRVATWLDPPLSARAVEPAVAAVPGSAGTRLRELSGHAARARRPLSHPRSFAQRLPFFTDPDLVGEFVGRDLVRERAQRQFEYVRRRVVCAGEGRFAEQAEFGHLLSFFRHNTVSQWRQLAYAHGKTVRAPFGTRSMAACALSVPASRRYVQGPMAVRSLTPKYLLKTLLAQRLPAYPTDQPKGSGSLPIERYVAEGPLADVFDRHDPPAFVPESAFAAHVESFGPVTWNLLTYALWRDRVLHDPDLSVLSGTRRFAWPASRTSV